MEYQLRRRIRRIGLTDIFLTSCSIVFFFGAMWILATDTYRGEALMVIGSIGALICAGLKSFGFWTCYKLIIVMNKYTQNDETDDIVPLAFEIFSNWLAAKKVLLIVPVLSFGFYIIAYWKCWVCVILVGGWIVLEIILIYNGGLGFIELKNVMEGSVSNDNQKLVRRLRSIEISV